MFSSRVPADLRSNRLALTLARRRDAGRPYIDLTLSNPTLAGIDYPADLLAPLGDRAGLVYHPAPLGLAEARRAVAADYARRGIDVAADRVVLTASTSEAYSVLFKLVCEPSGSAVLAPVPSYPLFDHLARLDGVAISSYALAYHGCWSIDRDSVAAAWSDGVRAVLAVSPNNPTGSVVQSADLSWLLERCAARGAVLIADEVFADYPLAGPDPGRLAPDRHSPCLLFRLGGLSKAVGLPQVKLGWIAVQGPGALVEEAVARLELICDTYLSVSVPAQLAAPALLEAGASVRSGIQDRVRLNYRRLAEACGCRPSVTLLHADAGWSAVLRVPATRPEEDLVVELLERDGVLVHPGYFFDFPSEAYLVVSLLPEPSVFARGVELALDRAHG